jgi:hypothetical protein
MHACIQFIHTYIHRLLEGKKTNFMAANYPTALDCKLAPFLLHASVSSYMLLVMCMHVCVGSKTRCIFVKWLEDYVCIYLCMYVNTRQYIQACLPLVYNGYTSTCTHMRTPKHHHPLVVFLHKLPGVRVYAVHLNTNKVVCTHVLLTLTLHVLLTLTLRLLNHPNHYYMFFLYICMHTYTHTKQTALPHYQGFNPLDQLPPNSALQRYFDRIQELDAYKQTKYPPEVVIWGWSKFFS